MAKTPTKTNGKTEVVCIPDYGNKPPNFSNLTPGYMVDQVGMIREMAKKCKKWEGWFKEALVARRGTEGNTISGESSYDGLFIDGEQVRIDADAVREYFKNDPATLATLMKTVPMVTLKTTPKPPKGS